MRSWRWQITDEEPTPENWSPFTVAGNDPWQAFSEAVRQHVRRWGKPNEATLIGYVAEETPENMVGKRSYKQVHRLSGDLHERTKQ